MSLRGRAVVGVVAVGVFAIAASCATGAAPGDPLAVDAGTDAPLEVTSSSSSRASSTGSASGSTASTSRSQGGSIVVGGSSSTADGGASGDAGADAASTGSAMTSASASATTSSTTTSVGTTTTSTSSVVMTTSSTSSTSLATARGDGGLDSTCTSGADCKSGVCEGGYCQEASECTADTQCGVGPTGMNVCVNEQPDTPTVGVCHPSCITPGSQSNCPAGNLCCNGNDANHALVYVCSNVCRDS